MTRAEAALSEAAMFISAQEDTLRNVMPLVPWLVSKTYATDLFEDVLDDVVARAVKHAMLPLVGDTKWYEKKKKGAPILILITRWLYVLSGPNRSAAVELAAHNALRNHKMVSLLHAARMLTIIVKLFWRARKYG